MLIMPLERVASALVYGAALALIASASPARAAGPVEVRLNPMTGRDAKILTYDLAAERRSGPGLAVPAAPEWSPGIAHWSSSNAGASNFHGEASGIGPSGDIAVLYRRLMHPRFTFSRRRIAVALTTGF